MSTDNKNGNMVVTPWEVTGDIDYNKLIERFGTQPLTEELKERIAKQAGFMHMQLRRNVYFSHRDLDWWLNQYDAGRPVGLYTGRGPSGPRPPWPPAAVVLLRVPTGSIRRPPLLPDDRRREVPTQRRPDARRDDWLHIRQRPGRHRLRRKT